MTIPTQTQLRQRAVDLGQSLFGSGLRLVTAESCTGGWIAKIVTDVAGSSAWFDCGMATYSNASKQALLGVNRRTLEIHGAVSRECVLEMASGALRHSCGDVAVAVSGIAGPGGGTEDKPVGTVWIAWQRRDRTGDAQVFRFDGDRDAVRRQAVMAALQGLRARL
ncbi:MAG: nicotinamide-nucleotide amidohydrolase family protein [Xanthomonadaceae bacterium]|jgi:nicotinamide-nucleotide amidase|nr:nicotinamide-nucleotide amidohydrolase family protein [Xanthomonadaceae bacterium]